MNLIYLNISMNYVMADYENFSHANIKLPYIIYFYELYYDNFK